MRLKYDTFATTVHGLTGRAVEEGILAAGTLIRNLDVEEVDLLGQVTTLSHFEASTDGGQTWYRHRTYANVLVRE